MKPGKHQKSKQRRQDLCWKVVHNLLFCVHTLCMSNVSKTFLLVSSSVSSKQLYCVLCTVKAKKENKNLEQRTLSIFITIPLH